MNVKCSCIKFNNNQCNKNSIIMIKNQPLCFNHSMLKYNKHVITIQKSYRGKKTRRYLENIYIKLPSELQDLIKFYININYHIGNYNNTIRKIIIKNTYSLHNYKYSDNKLSINYIYNCYKLYYKYHTILNINYLKHLYVLSDQILNYCNIILEQEAIELTFPYLIYDKIDLININETNIFKLIDIIYKYSNLYSSKYQIFYHYVSPLI